MKMGNTDHLYELWTLYTIKNEAQYVQRYIEEFAHVYDGLIDFNFELLDAATDQRETVTDGPNKSPEHHASVKTAGHLLENPKDSEPDLGPPNLADLPDGFLQAVNRQLMGIRDYCSTAAISSDQSSFKIEKIVYATNLVKSLAVICKNHENLKLLSSASLVGIVLNIATAVVQLITGSNSENAKTLQKLELFLHQSLYLCECLYDPLHTWRKRIKGSDLDIGSNKNITPLLNVDIIPFFYGTLQTHDRSLSDDLQRHFLHMFGALLCGSQRNALLASSSTTLDILLNFLSRYMGLEDTSTHTSPIKPELQMAVPKNANKLTLSLPLIEISGDGFSRKLNQTKDVDGARLVLRLIIKMVHVLHNAGPDQRQISVKDVLDEYFTLLTKANGNTDMQLQMIRFIPEFLNTLDRPALQMMLLQQGCFNHLKNVLQNYTSSGSVEESEQFSVQFVNIVTALVAGSMSAKEYFQENLGYKFLFERIRILSTPTNEIFVAFLNMAVESQMLLRHPQPIKNIFVVLMLMQWLPDIKQVEQQIWLATILKRIFTSCNENKIIACLCKVVTKVLVILVSHPNLHKMTVQHLLELIELLGTYSMSPRQTAAYIELLRQDSEQHRHLNPYFGRLIHSLSAMARKDTAERKSSHFFDLQDSTSGITVPEIKKWGGSGFSFHAWLCLNFHSHSKRRSKCRRQLYSFFSQNGTGMEAFFTPDCELVVAVCNKKHYLTVKLQEAPLTDNKWHCLHIVHHPAKRPFGSTGTLNIYIDGRLVMTTTLKCANLGETFSMCHIGSAGLRTSASSISLSTPGIPGTPLSESGTPVTPMSTYGSPATPSSRFSFNIPSPRQIAGSLSPTFANFSPSAFRSGLPSQSEVESASKTDRVVTIDAGMQDDVFGRAVSLRGQLGSVAAFNDVLNSEQIKALNNAGPDKRTVMNSDDVPGDLKSKLVVYYAAKACHRYVCRDLSPGSNPRDGTLTGHKIVTWDVKDSINAIGGVHVLFPLLEEINTMHFRKINEESDSSGSSNDEVIQDDSLSPVITPISEDVSWVVIESPKSSDMKLQKNHIAAFLILLKNFVAHAGTGSCGRHVINEDMLVQCLGIGTVGALLQKMPAELIDADVLNATQLLVESIDASTTMGSNLLQQVYQYLLFDFRIWSRSEFTVRIGHIQYLATVIKDSRKSFRKKYGVQYMLDVIKTYYCSSDPQLNPEDTQVIRSSLLGLVKYYAARDITADELGSILGVIAAAKAEQEIQLSECLDLLNSLLGCPCRGQLYLLLYEQGNADLFYVFLTDPQFSEVIRIKVCKMLTKLLKTDYVYEKAKAFLKLQPIGFSGLTSRMSHLLPTRIFCGILLEMVIEIDLGAGAFFAVLQFFHRAQLSTRRDAAKRLLDILYRKTGFITQCANQLAWQDTLTRLLVRDTDYTSRTGSFSYRSEGGFESLDGVPSLIIDSSAISTADESDFPEEPRTPATSETNGETLRASPDENKNSQQQQPQQKSLLDIFSKSPPSSASQESRNQPLKKPTSFPQELKKLKDNIMTQLSSPVMDKFGDSFAEMIESTSSNSLKQSGKTSPTLSDQYFTFIPDMENISSNCGSMSNLLDSDASAGSSKTLISASKDKAVAKVPPEDSDFGLSFQEKTNQIEEELFESVSEILFLIIWRGIDGTTADTWKARGQVFACLNKLSGSHDLVQPMEKIKLKILEQCVEAACTDLKDNTASGNRKATSGGTSFLHVADKSAELVRHVSDFLVNQGSDAAHVWSVNLMENLFNLLDILMVWDNNSESSINGSTEWVELASIGLRLLLGCVNTEKLDLVAMAAAKLHHLIHSRAPRSTEEICYILNYLHKVQCKSIKDDTHVVKFVVPLIRDMLDKNYDLLGLGQCLNDLPPTSGSATFFDDFVKYCQSREWVTFIGKHVQHKAAQHEEDTFRDSHNQMTKYWHNVMEDATVACHKRDRVGGESKLRFQAQIEASFNNKRTAEEERQAKNVKQLFNQHNAALRQWRATKRFLTSGRGPWKDRTVGEVAWKLSNVENFSRMRLKLTENYSFDPHTDASKLRDNVEIVEPINQMTAEDGKLIPASAVKAEAAKSSGLEDDSVGDEEWNTLTTNANPATDNQTQKEKVVFSAECHLVTLMDYIVGKLEISTTHVYFYDSSINKDEESGRDFKWSLQHLREAHFRRYNLRRSALELFLIDQSNYFINFSDLKQRNAAYKALLSVRPPNLLYFGSRSPQELLKASGLTQKWVQREISNFDYLMQLNTIAGRTYNDLSQYPVFPWVVADYTSEKLDLTNPASFRDLSKPVGVQNPNNEKEVRDKYDNFEDPSGMIQKFHYGTHYSNSAGVLHYLIRMEPFTTLHIQLQSGRFDLADRQFHSIPASWQAIMDNRNDVKELIPEFFCLPEFMVNMNGFDLGKHQLTKEEVSDVILPNWAKTPEEFVYKHRKALESEYISQHLHLWIDLIFGCKQRGEEAAKALNVFYYCTYEGAVDLDAITDPVQQKAVEGMINNFGQTPTQLLREPHPRRMTRAEAGSRVASRLSPLTGDMRTLCVLDHPDELKAFFVEVMPENDPLVFVSVPKYQSRSFIQAGMPDSLLTISKQGVLGNHGWLPYDKSITNYFTFEKDPSITNAKLQRKIQGLPIPGITLSARLFVISHDAKLLFVGGHWDNSVRVFTLGRSRNVSHLARHFDIVTCLALDNCGSHLISGSADTTCIIWQVIQHNGVSTGVSQRPLQVLYGHEDEVMCVAINTELDIAVSSSKDGTCIIHTVRKGNYVRTIQPVSNCPDPLIVPYIALSEEGHIALYAHTKKDAKEEKLYLHLYSINGKHLAVDCLESKLNHMAIFGEFLISGDAKGSLVIRELFSLEPISQLSLSKSIYCVAVAKSGSHILVTLRDGKLIIVGVGRPAETRPLFS